VMFIMIGTVALTSSALYERLGLNIIRMRLDLFAEGGLGKLKQELHQQTLTHVTGRHYKLSEVILYVRAEPITGSNELYNKAGISYLEGDVKAVVEVEYKVGEDSYKLERTYLTNLKTKRKEDILLSQKF
ncbi:MAG: hypothetical protein N2246_05305, partial [Candidatus Sumerlaeia bacterium]|nr:hypothetical protein [Candidatus Sumerlaeia bacterium]